MTVGIRIPAELPAAAEAYAEAGVKVFRVRRNKAPYANCSRCDRQSSLYIKHRPEDCQCGVPTCHGFWAATTDVALVRRWWAEEPDANIGAPCKLNGWAAIDMDPRNGGYQSLCRLEERVGVLPGTTMQITGGDGLHMIYLSPAFDLPGEPFEGVDFKHNGYILLAPSVHKSGARYVWPGTQNIFHKPETAWPAALLPRKERKAPPAPRPAVRPGDIRHSFWNKSTRRPGGGKMWTVDQLVQHVMDSVAGDRTHGRNRSLYFAACRAHELAEQGLINLAETESALLHAAEVVGLTDTEARATFDSAATRPSDRGYAA
ncbi:bifunctional DNA primase/polymerase [Streptomyces sp. NPDC094149]|uniref:bifunctional DNA primase/polymerase n=1 Tax=Streptomyces sp. NPDC094149 TaxID=3155079 RepID=UPI003328E7DC